VIVAVALLETATVVTVKVAVVAPAATVTEAGTVADAELPLRVTVTPPVGAALLIVTVPVEEFPPTTELGLRVTDDGVGAVIVKFAVGEAPLKLAVIVAAVVVVTATVVTVKVAVVAPEGMVTDAGVLAEAELSLREMTKPAAGAAEPIVTVPVDEFPPTTLVGDIETLDSTGGVIVRFAVAVWPPEEAVIVAVALAETGVVETVKVAVVLPEGTVTEAGTVAEALLLERLTTTPPGGAALGRLTVPVLEEPPTTEVGLRTSGARAGGVMVRTAV